MGSRLFSITMPKLTVRPGSNQRGEGSKKGVYEVVSCRLLDY